MILLRTLESMLALVTLYSLGGMVAVAAKSPGMVNPAEDLQNHARNLAIAAGFLCLLLKQAECLKPTPTSN